MKFLIEDDALTITFEGVEQLWALKHRLVVPKVNISLAIWQEGVVIPRSELGLRIGGTAIPGLLYAGRFVGSSGANFVYLQRARQQGLAVKVRHVLTLELKHSHYQRFIFTIDKPDIAEHIITWWSGNV